MTRITLLTGLAVVICALIAGWLVATANAANPRPDCPPSVRHCRIHYVSYSYIQHGHDQYGNKYVRTCHVPAHGKRWCGAWRLP